MSPQPGKDTPAVQARRQRRRERIVAAAVKLFGREGIHRVSMQQIAAEVGMSVGSLYQYLPNKEAIIAEATLKMDRANAEVLSKDTDAETLDWLLRETLRRTAVAPVESVALNLDISAEASRNPAVAERLAEQFEAACGLLAEAFGGLDPDLPPSEARIRAELYVAAQAGIGALRASRVPATALPELAERIVELVLPAAPDRDRPAAASDVDPTKENQ